MIESVVGNVRTVIYVWNRVVVCNVWRRKANGSERLRVHFKLDTLGLDGVE